MSDTDSFIEEVSEEVRRDRLFVYVRKYGWLAVTLVVLLVGGAAWIEWNKAQARAEAQGFGDDIIAALEQPDRDARAQALAQIAAPGASAQAVLALLTASEESESAPDAAAERLLALSDNPDVPQVYRQLAVLKAVTIPGSGIDTATRRERMEGLALTGGMVRLLAEEQLALIALEEQDPAAALERFQRIVEDAEATEALRQRARQMIVALGAEPAA